LSWFCPFHLIWIFLWFSFSPLLLLSVLCFYFTHIHTKIHKNSLILLLANMGERTTNFMTTPTHLIINPLLGQLHILKLKLIVLKLVLGYLISFLKNNWEEVLVKMVLCIYMISVKYLTCKNLRTWKMTLLNSNYSHSHIEAKLKNGIITTNW
jgi:hypothetical protein